MPTQIGYRFTESHEWLDLDGDVVTIGITQYAADELTDVTYVELKPAHSTVLPGESIGEVESVKTTADILTAVGGEIIEVNADAARDPSKLNNDPYGSGWLVRIRTADPSPLDALMDWDTYATRFPVSK